MENHSSKCNSCGTELTETDNFCPNCGKKRNTKSKKPPLREWWFWLVGLIAIGAIAIGGMDSVSEPVLTTSPTIEVPTTEEINETVASELLRSYVESTIGNYFDYYEININVDETIIAIKLANNGLGEAVFAAKDSGFDENFESWVELKRSHLKIYDSIREIATTLGLDDIVVTICIIDDKNHDRVFLVISDGAVLYDYMAS